MVSIDPFIVGTSAQILSVSIALTIAAIALMGFVRVRSWRLLALAVAFVLLACSMAVLPLTEMGWSYWSIYDGGSDALFLSKHPYVLDIASFTQMAAFFFIVAVYLDELKGRILKFSRLQLDLLAASIAVVVVLTSYGFAFYGNELGHSIYLFLALLTSLVLTTVIVFFLHSYFRQKKNTDTLISMFGFLLILSFEAHLALSYYVPLWSAVYDITAGWSSAIMVTVSLLGYVTFLTAIVRAKVIHDRD